jgi:hypothetical protein
VTQNLKLAASDAAANDDFSVSGSLSGTIGLVGAYMKKRRSGRGLSVPGLDTAAGTVTQNVKLTASDAAGGDDFGYSGSLSGDQFTIEAYSKNSSTGKAYTGTVSSVTTLDLGKASRTIDGLSFVSQDDWIVGQNTSANQVTLNAGNTANVTASSKVVYVGQNAGSNNNTLIIAGTLNANQIFIGAAGNTGNVLQLGNGGTTGSLFTGSVITNNGTLVFNHSNTITQGTDFGTAAITGTGGFTQAGSGTTIQNAANNYSGGTTIRAGTLAIAPAATIGGSLQVNSTGTLAISANTGGRTFANNLVLNGGTVLGAKENVGTGGTITTDASGNVIHTFLSSGTLSLPSSVTGNALVVGGGGGGAGTFTRSSFGGAGGGGTVKNYSGISTATLTAVIIGSGGPAGVTSGTLASVTAGNPGGSSSITCHAASVRAIQMTASSITGGF